MNYVVVEASDKDEALKLAIQKRLSFAPILCLNETYEVIADGPEPDKVDGGFPDFPYSNAPQLIDAMTRIGAETFWWYRMEPEGKKSGRMKSYDAIRVLLICNETDYNRMMIQFDLAGLVINGMSGAKPSSIYKGWLFRELYLRVPKEMRVRNATADDANSQMGVYAAYRAGRKVSEEATTPPDPVLSTEEDYDDNQEDYDNDVCE